MSFSPGRGRSSARRAQSNPLGYILLLGIIVATIGITVMFGGAALEDISRNAQLARSEHAMTKFDSLVARSALGSSNSQSMDFGTSSGSYEVDTDAGWIRIMHLNYTDGQASGPDNEVIYNRTVGLVRYERGDTVLAYQSGGVWRQDGDEGSRMISPPEFHYRDQTLTFPVIRVQGSGSASGAPRASISAEVVARQVYPDLDVASGQDGSDEDGAPYDPTDAMSEAPYANPLENGTVRITVHSRYYNAWAEYFRTRTQGNVSTFSDNQTAIVELVSTGGVLGDFDVPEDTSDIVTAESINENHTVSEFTLTLHDGQAPSGNLFNNMHWSMYTTGSQQFELHMFSDDGCNGGGHDGIIEFSIYYYDTSDGRQQEWQGTVDADTSSAVDIDCSDGTMYLDFMSDDEISYGDMSGVPGSGNKWEYGSEITSRSVSDPITFTAHPDDDLRTFNAGDSEDLDFLVNHYLSLMSPEVGLQVSDGPGSSSRIDETPSSGRLVYDPVSGERYIQFLQVTDNRVNVTFG